MLLVGRSRDRFPVVSLGIFSVVPPTEPCALRLTQPLKVSTTDLSWGKGGRCVGLTTYHPCSAETSRKSGALIYPEPLGPPRSVAGHLYFYCSNQEPSEYGTAILTTEPHWNIWTHLRKCTTSCDKLMNQWILIITSTWSLNIFRE